MEPIISIAGWVLVAVLAIIFAGLYFNTKQQLTEEKESHAFTVSQLDAQISLHNAVKEQLEITEFDRDKAYDKVTELKQELETEIDWRKRIATQKRVMRIHLGSYYERLQYLLNAAQLVKPKGTMSKAKYQMLQVEIERARDFLASKELPNTTDEPTSVSEKGGSGE